MANSLRHTLPFLSVNQSQKETSYNEAIRILDLMGHLRILDRNLSVPPSSPSDGDCYLIAGGASGDWVGQSNKLALYYSGWDFVTPFAGIVAYVSDEKQFIYYNGTSWSTGISPVTPVFAEKTANYTITNTDGGGIVPVDATSAAVNINLPVAQDVPGGLPITIKKMDATNNVTITAAVGNLLTKSEELDHSDWTKNGVTITANDTADYLGIVKADKIVEDSSTSTHEARQGITKAASALVYTFQCKLKADERDIVQVMFSDGADTAFYRVNLTTGAAVTTGTTGSFASASGTITGLANNWYLVTLTATTPTTTSLDAVVRLYNGASSYLGDGTSGAHATDCQLNQASSAPAYYYTNTAAGADDIDGAAIKTLTSQYESLSLVADGSNNRWLVV